MNSRNDNKKGLIWLALVFLIGIAIVVGNAFTVEAKAKVSKRALKEMIAGAKSPADHKAIADYYFGEAAKAAAKAEEHGQMAGWYRQAGEGVKKTPHAPGTIDHCERLVNDYRAVADEYTALAKEHEALAANKQ